MTDNAGREAVLLGYPKRPLVPLTEVVHERLSIEVFRGCTRGCRFCQAGMITRPVRERDAATLVTAAAEGINLQRAATVGVLTDLSYVQTVGQGVASVDIGFPMRYSHSAIECCDLSDLETLARLLDDRPVTDDRMLDRRRRLGRRPRGGSHGHGEGV